MMQSETFIVHEEDSTKRLDSFLTEKIESMSRNAIQHLISNGQVTINGTLCTEKKYKVKQNERITVTILEKLPLQPESIPLSILYEDDALLVVNKPKGMVVHPAPGNETGTLVHALLYYCKGKLSHVNTEERPGIVHRIDKDTSGILVVAKTDQAHLCLAKQLEEHSMNRIYHAIVYGKIKEDKGVVNAPIGRNPTDRKKMSVNFEHGKHAVTHYRVLKRFQDFTYIECRLETGRTHQIRVHMASIGHPLAGDPLYGPKHVITCLNGQCLHAKTLGFIHPDTKSPLFFDSALPDYFIRFLEKLEKRNQHDS